MIKKIVRRIQFYRSICFLRYLYLNYCCKRVVRVDQSRIIPYKGTILELAHDAKIYLRGGDIEIGCNQIRGSKSETRIRLRQQSVWSCEGGCQISYGSTIELLHYAMLDTQFFTMNSDSVLIAASKIQIGQDVMIGRGVVIYDSDYHAIQDYQGKTINPDIPVRIKDHVWLATRVTVLKGSCIGEGSIVSANSEVHGTIPPRMLYRRGELAACPGEWSRRHP